jgi:triosephosphate isomerase
MVIRRERFALSNWKMNKSLSEARQYVQILREAEYNRQLPVPIILCVPFTWIRSVAEAAAGSSLIGAGGQDVFWEERGAFTGEISAVMLADAGAKYCMIGHSERRKYFHETDEQVNKRARALLKAGIRPVVCIGETIEERTRRLTLNKLEMQVAVCFENFSHQDMEMTMILYEPLWAIGTGRVATPQQAAEAHDYIRKKISEVFSQASAERVSILYGGSVNLENVSAILECDNVDGVGISGASLDPGNFLKILRTFADDLPA